MHDLRTRWLTETAVSSPSGNPRQRAEEGRARSLGTGTIMAIVFGTIAALVLGYVGLQSSMTSSSRLASSQPATPVELDAREVQERLEQLRLAVTTKDLEGLDKLSVMSEDRRNWVEGLFRNYSTIEASLGELVPTPTDISSTLRIEKLILPNGEAFPVGPALQKIRLTISRKGTGWGKIHW
ncbi:MAG: hypothetical protein HP495_16525 [Nitrospira sp.]|nr:hypothetical protein [Nitrospira sp.]